MGKEPLRELGRKKAFGSANGERGNSMGMGPARMHVAAFMKAGGSVGNCTGMARSLTCVD